MPEKTSAGGASPFNLNSLLALLTLVGGIWLVSHKLASDRPVTPAGGTRDFVGDQAVEARLWEDPFKQISVEPDENKGTSTVIKWASMLAQIKARSQSQKSDKPVLLLPVMISGGVYGEDQESRIRSRFAIVSALGHAGFAPEDAEHIGAMELPWLTLQQNLAAKTSHYTGVKFWENAGGDAGFAEPKLLGLTPGTKTQLRYEWYKARAFSPTPLNRNSPAEVLVLWLDDRCFEDAPLFRLSVLLELFIDAASANGSPPEVALIGPCRSSTLRAMLPDWKSHEQPLSATLHALAQKVLSNVAVYSATASAMDEVLVDSPTGVPRASIKAVLENKLFKSFHNFTTTDLQLAATVLDELRLRNIDLKNDQNYVVLISEWDTFYGRMLSLTYGYKIWLEQNPDADPATFFASYRADAKVPMRLTLEKAGRPYPPNLRTFVYLRGLDGQTVGSRPNDKDDGTEHGRSGHGGPTSIEELRHWTPDANKAAGQAQFDYLGRLGDQIHELEKQLKHKKGGGRLKAVGIVGSDAYDTLLILQALRPRFPDVIFFTTNLDVRFLQPEERGWARNLVVASSYGLTLSRNFQGDVAPFRESAQTAQFAACLAALGNTDLANLTVIPPRRFEIGNRTAIDLSVTLPADPKAKGPEPILLHPPTQREVYEEYTFYYKQELGLGLIAVAVILGAACWWCRPLRRLTLQGFAPLYESIEYTEEDIGGPEGAEAILARIKTSGHPAAKWLAEHEWIKAVQNKLEATPSAPKDNTKNEREAVLNELVDTLVALLNQLSCGKNLSGNRDHSMPVFIAKNREPAHPWRILSPARRLIGQHAVRRKLDLFLGDLTSPKSKQAEPEHGSSALLAATAARNSARDIFDLRLLRLSCFWVGAIYHGALLAHLVHNIWLDTYKSDEGERLSFVSGTSAWPAEIVRLIVFILSVIFSFELYYKMGEGYYAVTRKFRLSFSAPKPMTAQPRGVCAVTLWDEYGKDSRFWKCVQRVAILVCLYFALCWGAVIVLSNGSVFFPVRGQLVTQYNIIITFAAFLGFLSLAFLTMDAARLCCEFIRKIGASVTRYPDAVRRHFSRLRGKIDQDYLDEWINLQLIAELTERVGGLAYYPSLLVLLLVVARNSWWDWWPWSLLMIILFFAHFAVALASVVILQRAAQNAKTAAEESLTAKVKKLQAQASPSVAQNNAAQAEQLLDEVRNLQRGAFVPFWKNPVVGAVFLSSGGTTMLQVFVWMMGR